MPPEAETPDPITAEPLDRAAVIEMVEALESAPGFTLRDEEYASMRALLLCQEERAPVIPGVNIDAKVAALSMSPEIEDDAHLYRDRMLSAQMSISVRAKAEGPKAEAAAAKIKRFLEWHFAEWRAQHVFDGPLFHLAAYGCGILRPVIDWDAVPNPPEYQEGESAQEYLKRAAEHLRSSTGTIFRLEPLDYATIYHEWDWSVAAQVARVPLPVLNRAARAKGKRVSVTRMDDGYGAVSAKVSVHSINASAAVNETSDSAWDGDVKLVVLDDGKHIYQFVYADAAKNGELLDVIPNVWGECSFVPVPGDITGEPHPLYGYRALLAGKYRTVPLKNLLATVLFVAGVRAGQQRYTVEWVGPGDVPRSAEAVTVSVEDEVLKVDPPGYAIRAAKLDLGFDVAAALDYLQRTDRYGFPEEISRPGEVKASSGYERARITDTISSTLDPPLEHVGAAVRRICRMMLHAIKVLDIPVTVRTTRQGGEPETPADVLDEITLDPADIVDVDVRVSFDSLTQYSHIANQEVGMQLREKGLKTDSEFLAEDRGIDDVPGWYRRKARDEMRSFVRELAINDAKAAIEAIRASVIAGALDEQGVDPELRERAGITTPQEDAGDGMAVPTGPSSAMPVVPPEPEELSAPTEELAGGVGVG